MDGSLAPQRPQKKDAVSRRACTRHVGAFGILLFFWPRRGPPAKIGRLGDSSEREGRGTTPERERAPASSSRGPASAGAARKRKKKPRSARRRGSHRLPREQSLHSDTVPLPESAPTPEKVCGKRDRACRARLTEAQRVATAAGASQADQQLGLFEKEYQNAERKEKRKAENGNFENINY